jgi:outer membrane protein assembly factor BamB
MKESEMVAENTSDTAAGKTAPPAAVRPLRAWPALVLVVLMVAARFGPTYLEGGLSNYWMIAVFGPLLCCVLILIWWLAASRATWKERVFGLLGLLVGLAVTVVLVHPTMRGPGTTYLTAPMGFLLFGLSAAFLAKRRPATRTGLSVLLAFVGFGYSLLLRNEGMTGEYAMDTYWRWTTSAEATMLAAHRAEPGTRRSAVTVTEALATAEWPGFRGADRTGHSRGPQISTNWSSSPPKQLWKIPVGPGWSSFAVAGKLLFTQEQRGPMETVVCYDADTGHEIWTRQIETRFDDPLGGPGPRATPTIANGGLFVMGATGMFLRLNPATGAIVWQQDLKAIAGRTAPPMWGFSASPLVTGSVAIAYGGGAGDKGLVAFDVASGKLQWSAAAGADSYSSPQLNTIAGEELVLLLSNEGLVCVEPAAGKERLNYQWKFQGYRALQPTVIGDTVLLPTAMNLGTRAIRISKKDGQLAAEELWTSRNLKPDFTDLIVHQGHVYGIDGGIFTCVDLKTGERKWKGGRYGKGQAVLLENSGLLLVSAEDGRVVLLRADPGEHSELASFKALEGKTWNHPVVVGDRLYVRNAQEAACYQLTLAETKAIAARF